MSPNSPSPEESNLAGAGNGPGDHGHSDHGYPDRGYPDHGLLCLHLEQIGQIDAAIAAYLSAGEAAYLRLDLTTALDWYEQAERLMPDERESSRKRYCLRERARALRLAGQSDAAKRLLLDIIERSVAAHDPVFATSCRVMLGFLECSTGRIDQGIDLLYDLLLGDQSVIPTEDLATISSTLAYAYYLKGQYTESIEHGERAAAIARRVGNAHSEGEALALTANSYVDVGWYREAIEMYEAARAIQHRSGDRRGVAVSDLNIGYCHAWLGNEPEADASLDRALSFATAHNGQRTRATAHHYLGVAREVRGRWEAAIAAFRMAHELRLATNQTAHAMESLAAMERIRHRKGFPADLPPTIDEVASWLEAVGPQGMEDFASACATCVSLLVAAGQSTRARALLSDGQAHLTQRASLIRDDDMRRSYLAIPSNRTLRLMRIR